MKDAPTIEIPADEAKLLYEDYAEQIKERGDKAEQYLKDLKSTYYHLSQGRKVIDIFEVFKKSGVKENGDPYLGIARADQKKIFFHKQAMGAGTFSSKESTWNGFEAASVSLPSTTFGAWENRPIPADASDWQRRNPGLVREKIQTKVPVIPAHIMPNGSLENYFILFEAPEWTEIPVPPVAADPYLLKRINANAFVVLAEWDVSEIELAVMRGVN